MESISAPSNNRLYFTVLVAALGYFVDIYDIQIFNIVSVDSLKGIGITDPAEIDRWNASLFLWQMGGMLLGGILWGIYGDKKGRKSVLFGSIIIYSLANIANSFATNIPQYEICRLLAGFGLAGELGAAITLTSEMLPAKNRGLGTVAVVSMGVLGVVAAVIVKNSFNWQTCYQVGGGLGIALLLLRFKTFESGMFEKMNRQSVAQGNFWSLFADRERALKYICCIMLGLPIWYALGILIKFSPKFAALNGVVGAKISVATAILYAYIGLSAGDLVSGILSQVWQSRKKVVLTYIGILSAVCLVFLNAKSLSSANFYLLCFLAGIGSGYWALFVTVAAEQFGTNIRSTVTTTVPNFVRGAVIPMTAAFLALGGNTQGALIVGAVCVALSLIAVSYLGETFGKNLEYVE